MKLKRYLLLEHTLKHTRQNVTDQSRNKCFWWVIWSKSQQCVLVIHTLWWCLKFFKFQNFQSFFSICAIWYILLLKIKQNFFEKKTTNYTQWKWNKYFHLNFMNKNNEIIQKLKLKIAYIKRFADRWLMKCSRKVDVKRRKKKSRNFISLGHFDDVICEPKL